MIDLITLGLLVWLGVGTALVLWSRTEYEREILLMAFVETIIWPGEVVMAAYAGIRSRMGRWF